MVDDSRIDRMTIAGALRLARGNLADAFVLHQKRSRNASYLAEQALEQMIRALATSEGIHIARADAHQLDRVLRAFPHDNPVAADLRRLSWLEAYATTFRYVQPSGRLPRMPEPSRMDDALGNLETYLTRLEAHFGIDAQDADAPARSARPIRS